MAIFVCGQRVMLNTTLAKLHEAQTKVLLQVIKCNIDRFPADFMFRFAAKKLEDLRSASPF